LQAVRSGNVLIANSPGSAFLESPAILGFLPSISEQLLNQPLLLPAMDTWWCGESAALQSALQHINNIALKPTYPSTEGQQTFPGTLTQYLNNNEIQDWIHRINQQPNEYTVQKYLHLAQMPTWQNSSITQKSYVLRVFALRNGADSWRVLPGGLVRIASNDDGITSMQRGGSSADAWVRSYEAPKDQGITNLYTHVSFSQKRRVVTSRAAENLFWFGRYTERSENTVRLTRLYLKSLSNEYPSNSIIWTWFENICKVHQLVSKDTPANFNALHYLDRTFEKNLIESLHTQSDIPSVGFNLQAMQNAASSVRERLATDQWTMVQSCVKNFKLDMNRATLYQEYSSNIAIEALNHVNNSLAAITGGQTDRMTRDDGWQLLSIGRHIERLFFFSSILQEAIDIGLFQDVSVFGFDAVLYLFDSTITYHSQHQQNRDLHALVDLLITDPDNPRSFAWVVQEILHRLDSLNRAGTNPIITTNMGDLKIKMTHIDHLCLLNDQHQLANLKQLINEVNQSVIQVAEDINATYFNHIYKSNYRI
jgi:uncharacterized alpha-E superfamily protein